jgi:hypothetical protein
MMGKLKSKGRHPMDPVYCILVDGLVQHTFDRQTVGTGLREFLFLYEKARGFGRGRLAALSQALDKFFL